VIFGTERASARFLRIPTKESEIMDKEHVKGGMDKVSGAAKDAVGRATGDEKLQAEGKMDKAKGEIRQTAGDVKDALKGKDRPN
jgi:uncharacterized protein YjbJ (UPF0337 family)